MGIRKSLGMRGGVREREACMYCLLFWGGVRERGLYVLYSFVLGFV